MDLGLEALLLLLLDGRAEALEAVAPAAPHPAVVALPVDEAGLHAAVGLGAHRALEDDGVGLVGVVEAVARADGPPGGSR